MLKIFGYNVKNKIIKYIAWSVASLVLLFVAWQALLIANVYTGKGTAKAMIGNDYYMHDYYYADISNITYTGHNFLLYVQKPFLFSPKHFYLYSSKDGINWKREFTSTFGGLDGFVQNQRFGRQQIFNESGELYTYISKEQGYPDTYWRYSKNFPVYDGKNCYVPYENNADNGSFIRSEDCSTNWIVQKFKRQRFTTIYQESYPNVNIQSFNVLKNIVQKNNLDISLGIAHTAYGNGKYIGIYKRINKYYAIISSDGIHYKSEELPSNVINSLAISVFNN